MKRNLTLIITAALTVHLLSGCAAAVGGAILTTTTAAGEVDRAANSTKTVPDAANSVTVEKYQFFPDAAEMTALCEQAVAAKYGSVNKATFKVTHSRNILTGYSKCVASN